MPDDAGGIGTVMLCMRRGGRAFIATGGSREGRAISMLPKARALG
jgi:hypothetical protein